MQLFVPTHPALPIILMEPVVYEESPLADYLKGKCYPVVRTDPG